MKLPSVINEPATINTPQIPVNPGDMARLGAAEGQALSNIGDAADTLAEPVVEGEALRDAQQITRDADGNVQVAKAPFIPGKLGQIYENTYNTAFAANLTGQAGNDLAAMAAKTFLPTDQGGYGGDPQKFYAAGRAYVSSLASKQYGNQGVALQIGNQIVDQHMRSLIGQRSAMDADNAKQSILARIGDLDNANMAMAASNYNGPEMRQGLGQITDLINTLAADPRMGWSPDYAKSKIAEMTSRYQATAIVGEVAKAYDPSTGGGFQKAQDVANRILTDTSLDLTQAERRQFYDLSMSQIRLNESQRRAASMAMQPEANQVLAQLRAGQPVDPAYLDDFQQRAAQNGAGQIWTNVEIAKERADIAIRIGPQFSASGNSGIPALNSAPNAGAASQNQISDYISQRAQQLGIDPQTALRVASSEGLRAFDPGRPDKGGDGGSSFGPFQLHYGNVNPSMPHGGLGDEFTKATGLDARDPSTWPQQVDFALQWAKQHGWGDWMGARAQGITGFAGIGPTSASGQPVGAKMPASVLRADAQDQANQSTLDRLQAIRDGKLPATADPVLSMIINKNNRAAFDTQFQSFTKAVAAFEVPPLADVEAIGQQAQIYGTPEQRQQIAELAARAQFGNQFEQLGQSTREAAISGWDQQLKDGANANIRSIVEYARNLDKHMADDFAADPYGAAAKYGLNTQSSQIQLDFSNPQALAAGFRSRAIDAPLIQTSQGVAPVSLIRPGERSAFVSALRSGDTNTITGALSSLASVGPDNLKPTLADKDISSAIIGLSRSSDPARAAAAFGFMDQIDNKMPLDFNSMFGEQAASDLMEWRGKSGFMTPQAFQKFRDQPKDAAAIAGEKALAEQAAKLVAKNYSTPSAVAGAIEGLHIYSPNNWNPWHDITPVADDPSGSAAAMQGDFSKLFTEGFSKTGGNQSVALDYATKQIAQKWAPSVANGGRITAYPPEHYLPQIYGSYDWIHDQLADGVKQFFGDHMPADFAVQADRTTLADVSNNRPPSYVVVAQDSDGLWHRVESQPGTPMRFAPDVGAAKQMAVQKAIANKASRDAIALGKRPLMDEYRSDYQMPNMAQPFAAPEK